MRVRRLAQTISGWTLSNQGPSSDKYRTKSNTFQSFYRACLFLIYCAPPPPSCSWVVLGGNQAVHCTSGLKQLATAFLIFPHLNGQIIGRSLPDHLVQQFSGQACSLTRVYDHVAAGGGNRTRYARSTYVAHQSWERICAAQILVQHPAAEGEELSTDYLNHDLSVQERCAIFEDDSRASY